MDIIIFKNEGGLLEGGWIFFWHITMLLRERNNKNIIYISSFIVVYVI